MRNIMVTQKEWQGNRRVAVGELKASFHGVFQLINEDSMAYPVAVVEYEDGRMEQVDVADVRFTDRPDTDQRVERTLKVLSGLLADGPEGDPARLIHDAIRFVDETEKAVRP